MKKRILSVILAVTASFGMTVFASDEAVRTEEMTQKSIFGMFTVSETGEDYILGIAEENTKIQFNISDDTILIDSVSKNAVSINDIKIGEEIAVDYETFMTKSIPPQTSANLIMTNISDGGMANLTYVSQLSNDENGNLVITDDTTDTVITVSKDAKYLPYKTKNIVRADDIKQGSVVLLWYDTVTLSIPAQAYTENVVIISTPDESDDFVLTVNGKEIDTENKPYYDGETLMVPLRAISETLGYNVSYEDETEKITVSDQQVLKATLYPGSDEVSFEGLSRSIDSNRTVKNAKETRVIEGHTYIPLEFFKEFSNETTISGNSADISSVADEK